MNTTTNIEPDWKKICQALKHEKYEDCQGCDWRIQYIPKFKFFTLEADVKIYNHSLIVDIEPKEDNFEVTLRVWNRKPGDPALVVFEAKKDEIRIGDTSGQWVHVSPFHPSKSEGICTTCKGMGSVRTEGADGRVIWPYPKCTDCGGKVICQYARPRPRCPKCKSVQVKTTQEAYGDSTNCPECGFNSFFSIGD